MSALANLRSNVRAMCARRKATDLAVNRVVISMAQNSELSWQDHQKRSGAFSGKTSSEHLTGLAVATGVSAAGSVVSGMTARAANSSIASTMNAG